MSSPTAQPSITPPSLSSLAIYNPSLGPTDDTVDDQIVFFTSREPHTPNEKLRQVGLAQGVVEFARGFNKKENLSHIETERSRIVVQEVEQGWWILAHIDFTRTISGSPDSVEYSSRDVSHPRLLLAQLLSAYNQFRFLYGTLESNLHELGRERFCRRLERYWLRWVRRWDVSPAGNPAVEIWGGINMAQPRIGAAAREVLEAYVAQEKSIEGGGFVDMVISRFGKAEDLEQSNSTTAQPEPLRAPSGLPFSLWPASTSPSPAPSRTQSPGRPPSLLPLAFTPEPEPIAREVTASDGCILPGTGHLQPAALRDISTWACNLYLWHEDKITNSTRSRRGKRPKLGKLIPTPNLTSGAQPGPPGPPTLRGRKNIVSAPTNDNGYMGEHDLETSRSPSSSPIPKQTIEGAAETTPTTPITPSNRAASAPNELPAINPTSSNTKFLNLLTFGWAGGSGGSSANEHKGRGGVQSTQNTIAAEPNVESHSRPVSPTKVKVDLKKSQQPRFLYGYMGDLDDDGEDELDTTVYTDRPENVFSGKITEKIVWLPDKLCSPASDIQLNGTLRPSESMGQTFHDHTLQSSALKPFRMVVYLNPPFTFISIFEPQTPRLSSPSFYRSLHLRLGPLRTSLLPFIPKCLLSDANTRKPVVYNLLFDPVTLVISASLPNIPSYPSYVGSHTPPPQWSRVDAIHVHNHILNIYADLERGRDRNSRTTRGWWLAYSRLGSSKKEAILVWKGDERGKGGKDPVAGKRGSGDDIESRGGSVGLDGILDTRRYFEGLLRGRG